MEASSISSSSSVYRLQTLSTRHESTNRPELFPVRSFDGRRLRFKENSQHGVHVDRISNSSRARLKSGPAEEQKVNSSEREFLLIEDKADNNSTTCKTNKKRKPHGWRRRRFLGC